MDKIRMKKENKELMDDKLTKKQFDVFKGWVQINFNEPEQIESLEELTVEEIINDFAITVRSMLLHKKKMVEEAVLQAMKRSD